MTAFVDPRSDPSPSNGKPPPRLAADPSDLKALHQLCRQARVYEVERWIAEGRPLQLAQGAASKRRAPSALEIALEKGQHALVLLLLCNGYDPNLEEYSPLDLALQSRSWDLLDLLLAWGADPRQADLADLFGTYNSKLFDRFHELGVELSAGHEMAAALGYHTSNKPLYGWARRHRKDDSRIQRELDIALAHHAGEGNEKGVQLCLWAGADPRSPVPSLRYGDFQEGDEDEPDTDEHWRGFTAIAEACLGGHADVLEKLGPDPELDDFDELYLSADDEAVIRLLARFALPTNVGEIIQRRLMWLGFDRLGWGSSEWRVVHVLECLFEVGARWEAGSKDLIVGVRRSLLKASDHTFVEVMKLLARDNHCAPEVLAELGRTPAIRKRMKEVGFLPLPPDHPRRHEQVRPTRSREVLARFGVELPKPKVRLPSTVWIGHGPGKTRELRMSRKALFERVWSVPVATLAAQWGLSGRGLAKACQGLKIPLPPRGYWQKKKAGHKVRRPPLPRLPDGQAEEVVVYVPDESGAEAGERET